MMFNLPIVSSFSHRQHLKSVAGRNDRQRLVVTDDDFGCGEGDGLGKRSLEGDIRLPISHRSGSQCQSEGHILLVFRMDSIKDKE